MFGYLKSSATRRARLNVVVSAQFSGRVDPSEVLVVGRLDLSCSLFFHILHLVPYVNYILYLLLLWLHDLIRGCGDDGVDA